MSRGAIALTVAALWLGLLVGTTLDRSPSAHSLAGDAPSGAV
jgi:hypothetical protein